MSTLTNKTIAGSYKDLLQVSNGNIGVDGTCRFVEDGEGTQSILSVSTSQVGIGVETPSSGVAFEVSGIAKMGSLKLNDISLSSAQLTDLLAIDSDDFATAAQGGLADTALQSGDVTLIGLGFTAGDYATAAQGGLADTALQSGDVTLTGLGFTAGDYATAAQGGLADTSLQVAGNGIATLQGTFQLDDDGGTKGMWFGDLAEGQAKGYIGGGVFAVNLLGENDFGISASAGNNIAFGINGNEAARISSDGKVGIGTMSSDTNNPVYPLELYGKSGNSISITSDFTETNGTFTRIQHAAISTTSTGYGKLGLFSDVGNSTIELNASGNSYLNAGMVAIGTKSPTARLHVNNGSGNTYSAAGDVFRNVSSLTNGVHALALHSGGWVNAGVMNHVTGVTEGTLPSYGLYLNSSYGSKQFASSSIHANCATGEGDIRISTGNGNSAPTEKVRIKNNGTVLLGAPEAANNPGIQLQLGGFMQVKNDSESSATAIFQGTTGTAKTHKLIMYADGSIANSTGSVGTLVSDARLKENVVLANGKLDDLMKLEVKNFNLVGNNEKHIGFIAQEMEEVFPSLVSTKDMREYNDDGSLRSGFEDQKGLKTGMDFAILVKAIQELKIENDSLKSRLAVLESA